MHRLHKSFKHRSLQNIVLGSLIMRLILRFRKRCDVLHKTPTIF